MEPSNGFGTRSPWSTSPAEGPVPHPSNSLPLDNNAYDFDPNYDSSAQNQYSSHQYHTPRPTTNLHDDGHYGDGHEPGLSRNEIVSQASELDSPVYTPGDLDDRVHLTSSNTVWKRSAPYERDLERRRKHTLNRDGPSHNLSPIDIDSENRDTGLHSASPRARRGGLGLKAMSKSIKRASVRVVNFAGADLDDRPVRLNDVDDHDHEHHEHGGGALREENTILRGKTLGIFSRTNPVRLAMHKMLTSTFTEATILLLIILNAVILTIQSAHHAGAFSLPSATSADTDSSIGYFHSWEDYALFGLFCLYTLEALCRIIVSGLIIDPEIPFGSLRVPISGLQRQGSFTSRISSIRPRFMYSGKGQGAGTGKIQPGAGDTTGGGTGSTSSVPMWDTKFSPPVETPSSSNSRSRLAPPNSTTSSRLAHQLSQADLPFVAAMNKSISLTHTSRPYLRHSWNRVDAVAILAFWTTFVLCTLGAEMAPNSHLYLFRALSVLRTTRLLAITSGTTTIMLSLKKAAPQLVNVAMFVLFAVVLFSIVGVQSFGGSFRRNCVLSATDGVQMIQLKQQCGRWIDPTTLNEVGYITVDNVVTDSFKGFTCPFGQVCQETLVNPASNAMQFDNILGAALQIIIIASANGWSTNMYAMMSSEFFISCAFFISCLVVLNFWLLNLFVAVITQSFGASRAETKRSAFGAETDIIPQLFDEDRESSWGPEKENALQRAYRIVSPFFALLALASLTLQAIRTTTTPANTVRLTMLCELGITIAFGIEIIWRVSATLPRWRRFFSKKQNVTDLFLAVACGVILVPPIPDSQAYPWLTAFQLMRFYRVILLVPGMRMLLFQVFGNMRGLVNMSIFLILANYLAALFAIQLFRSDVPATFNMNYQGITTSFLAMYQVFTSENWTDVMWAAGNAEFPFKQQVLAILFVVFWFFFANFIMLQMFIAVINENFEVAEEEKRAQQLHAYVRRAEPTATTINWLDRLNPYRRMKANPRAINVDALPENLVLPLKKSVIREYRNPGESSTLHTTRGIADMPIIQGPLGTMRRFMGMDPDRENVPLTHIRGNRPHSEARNTFELDETERHLEAINAVNHDTVAEDNRDALLEQRARQADFINDHPSYDKTLWIFTQSNPIRQFCQRLVPPSNGDDKERIYGLPASPWLELGFRAIMLITVIAGIVIAGVAGPLYRRGYFNQFTETKVAWFDLAEAVFGFLLVVEFLVKVIADGFIFTPNAYLLNIWNILDLVILIAILINVLTSLIILGGLSRGTRALKAFRALRLITLLGWMRETFHSVIFAGARRIVDAAVLALLYMVPYAVWGLNIFHGRMLSCNDGNALGSDDCQNEFFASPVDNSLQFLAPRVWDNPSPSTSFSFDSFDQSFLILFEIVSLEGWIDVLKAALNITGISQQPSINASQINALFFVLYNLLGAVVILTLFVSIIISNFSSRSGMALLTAEQRQWIDLKKLISRQKPSKRPHVRPTGKFQSWCFDRAVKKRGWWSSGMTFLYCVQIAILMSATFTDSTVSDKARDFAFLALAVCFLADPFVKFIGLGWRSFRSNGWNIFDVVVILGSIGTTIVTILDLGAFSILDLSAFSVRQAQKLFLVCVAFKLMQKLDGLNQLFKTAVSSLGVIAKLFGLWFSLFLFFGILWLEVFALTKWGSGEFVDQNYQSFGATLVMMVFMSTGEQWNQYMHDYAISYPRCTNSDSSLEQSDCGSMGWSFTLFITWNVLSMYIFVNMFTGVVVENFSYIYQQRRNQTLNREEMRAFKKVWAQFDQSSTGYLDRSKIVPFLAKLTGVFEVRIYPSEYQFLVLYENSKASASEPYIAGTRVGPLDLRKLDRNLRAGGGLDHDEVRRRRKVYNRVFWEARLLAQGDARGIPFIQMLLLLAHHKLIDDDKALKVDEIIRRRAITEQVEDRVNFDKVRTLFRMIYLRKKFLARWEVIREEKRRAAMNGVPEIIVAEPRSPPLRTWDITRAHHAQGHDSMGTIDLDSPSPTGRSFHIPPSPPPPPLHPNPDFSLFHSGPATNPPDHVSGNPFINTGAGVGMGMGTQTGSNPYGTYGQSNNNNTLYGLTGDPWATAQQQQQQPHPPPPLSPNISGVWSDPASPSARSRNPYRTSDMSMLSRGSGSPRGNSPSGSPGRGDRTMSTAEDPNAVLTALNASGWREMMMHVAEEEDEDEEGEGEGGAR